MEEPLFGERQQKTQIFFYLSAGAVTLFVLFSVIVSIVFGINKHQHFVMAIALLCEFAVLVVLTRWYRAGDLDPKTKYLIIFFVLAVILSGVALNTYVWEKPPSPIECTGLYDFATATCYKNMNNCFGPTYCVQIDPKSPNGYCVEINPCPVNTTTTSTTKAPPPEFMMTGHSTTGRNYAAK